MKTFFALTKRNVKVFFKDKGLFFSSLITPIILLVLYSTFLANVYKKSFLGPDGFEMPESTSLPNICTANGFSLSQVFSNNFVFSSLYKSAFALTISVYTSPASFSLQINLNGRSVMPAIGAKNMLFSSSTFPIFKIYLI